jgi:predicted GTPase
MTTGVDLIGGLIDRITEEYRKAPPTIAVIGVSGVGKSSTINAMFGTRLKVSATVRGTSRWAPNRFTLEGKKILNRSVTGALTVYDAVGLGEDIRLDANYLARYAEHLKKCDAAIWITAARNRAVALDQTYMDSLRERLGPLVVGLNQVDLVEPLDWSDGYNIPSRAQAEHIEAIVADRARKFTDVLGRPAPIVPYSARRFYNLGVLFKEVVQQVPQTRRWMFQMIKGFSADDWLQQATGLTEDQKQEIAKQRAKTEGDFDLLAALRGRMGLKG